MQRTPQIPFLPGDIIRERYNGFTTNGVIINLHYNGKDGLRLRVKTERDDEAPFFTLCDPAKTILIMPQGGWPVRYGDWEISLSEESLAPRYQYIHKDYDGPEDGRGGHADTLREAMEEIDERET